MAVIQATSLGTWLGKPPLAVHSFDVTLENPSKEPRWLIVPSSFGEFAGLVDETELQIFKLSDKVWLAYGVSGHFQTVKLPGRGKITLRQLKIESWNEPKSVEIEVLVAKSVKIGDTPLENWVPASAGGQDVKAPIHAGDPRAEKFQHPNQKLHVEIESRAKSAPIQLK